MPADPGLAEVMDVGLGDGLVFLQVLAEALEGDVFFGVVLLDEVFGLGQVAGEDVVHGLAPHAAALLEDGVVHPALDLEEDGRLGVVVVEAEAEFEAVFVPVDRVPVNRERLGVEVKAVDGVGVVGLPDAVVVQHRVGADEPRDRQRGVLWDDVFQLPAL